MPEQPITLSLVDQSAGFEATPGRVRLHGVVEFLQDVETFLKGESGEVDTSALEVAVIEGSFAIRTAPIPTQARVFADLRRLECTAVLDGLDTKRQRIVDKWQRQARSARKTVVRIDTPELPQTLQISEESDFHAADQDQWVDVERYVRGEVLNLGGVTRPNAHVRLPNGKTLKVVTDRELLQREHVNRVYQQVLLRVRARLNLRTGVLDDARLIEFVEHTSEQDEDLSALRERGAKAWGDIPDAAAWVEELRGGASK